MPTAHSNPAATSLPTRLVPALPKPSTLPPSLASQRTHDSPSFCPAPILLGTLLELGLLRSALAEFKGVLLQARSVAVQRIGTPNVHALDAANRRQR